MVARARGLEAIREIPGSRPGYLRFPVRVADGRAVREALGVVRGYPDTLAELAELRPSLLGDEPLAGARELQRTLVTLPTHAMVGPRDLAALERWIRGGREGAGARLPMQMG